MPEGDKSKYTEKQKRGAAHIQAGYEKRGVPGSEAVRRAWATVNKTTGGGKKPGGSGRGKADNPEPVRTGGRKGGSGGAPATRALIGKKTARARQSKVLARK